MKTRKKRETKVWFDEKQLRKVPFLICEDYRVTEKELEECRWILEKVGQRAQASGEHK